MGNYAVVIGVNRYENADWNLEGAVDDAVRFAHWALNEGDVAEENLRLLLAGDAETDLSFAEAESRNINQVLDDLRNEGAGEGLERLFFYYAGHGVSAPGVTQGTDPAPMLIPSDVQVLPRDSNRCVPFSGIMPVLNFVPPAEQFFFIDACRDFLFEGYRAGVGSGGGRWMPPREAGATSGQFALYATSPGERAQEQKALRQGVFGASLLEGLTGAPAASRWSDTGYEVSFRTLTSFVRDRTKEAITKALPKDWKRYLQEPQSFAIGAGDPMLARIGEDAMQPVQVTLRVSPSEARETCELRLLHRVPGQEVAARGGTVDPPVGHPAKMTVLPFNYVLEAQASNYRAYRRKFPVWRTCVDDLALEQATEDAAAAESRSGPGRLIVTCDDPDATIIVTDSGRRPLRSQTCRVDLKDLAPGVYTVRLVTAEGRVTDQYVEVRPGSEEKIALAAPGPRLATGQVETLRRVGIAPDEKGFVRPADKVAPLANARLGTLLAYAALAAHSPGLTGFDSLREFGIEAFTELELGSAALLAIVASSGVAPAPGVSTDSFVRGGEITVRNLEGEPLTHEPFDPLPGMPTASQAGVEVSPGCVTAELRIPGLAPTRYALTALPDRVTVLIAVAEDSGAVEVQQYLIPLRDEGALADPKQIRRLDVAQRHYARGGSRVDIGGLEDLLIGKWLDPLLGALAGYELIRTDEPARYVGHPKEGSGLQPSAMNNMLNFFGGLPDSHVLAGLCQPERREEHFRSALERGLPVFGAGFRALHEWHRKCKPAQTRPLWVEPSALIPGSPWTAWVAERPAIGVRNGSFRSVPPGWGVLDSSRAAIEEVIQGVGGLGVKGSAAPISGTAFAVGPGVVMTMKHICPDQVPVTDLTVDFGDEPGTTGPRFPVTEELGVIERSGAGSIVLLRTAESADDGTRFPTPLAVAPKPPQPVEGHRVVVCGYPFRDRRVPEDVLSRVFGDTYGVKRLQPGQILMVERNGKTFRHDCLTLGGNGGSPVVDVETGLVLGVHFAGEWHEYKRGHAMALWAVADHPVLQRHEVRG